MIDQLSKQTIQRLSTAGLPRRAALSAYYFGTWWLRSALGYYLKSRNSAPVIAVFYHRVADDCPNDWTISRIEFERQMHWLVDRFDMISLAEAQRRVRHGARRPAACVTFDDGYAENCEFAIPLLLQMKVPTTYFVTTEYVRRGKPFPHDTRRGQPLPPNTREQIRAMAAAGIEIGAHTHSHLDLGRIHDARRIRDEVIGSGDVLEQWIGGPVRSFAFPYGQPANWTAAAFQVALERYDVVCSAYGGYNFRGSDPRHLQRLHGDPCFARFRNQTGLDPRLVASPPVYQHAATETHEHDLAAGPS